MKTRKFLSAMLALVLVLTLMVGMGAMPIFATEFNDGDVTLAINVSKPVFTREETAEVNATLTGDAEGELTWFINGMRVEAEVSETLTISMADYNGGEKLVVSAQYGDVESNELVLWVSYDVKKTITSDENYEILSTMDIVPDGAYGNYKVGTDDGNYIYMTEEGGGFCDYIGAIPTSTGFIFEYKIFVPEDIANMYYVYPVFVGLDAAAGTDPIEAALEIGPNGIRPYLKNQNTGVFFDQAKYDLGLDTSYAGASKLGDWNTITVAVLNSQVVICINEEQALFVTIPTLSVPSALTFNIWPGAGDVIPLKIKDFVVGGIVTPAPVVESVSVSASKVEAQIGETIKFTANLTPYNAEAESVEWYVNGMQVEGDSLNFDYVAEQTGSCEVYCVVDGVASTSKTVTISEPSATENNPNTPKKPVDSSAGVIIAIAIAIVVVVAAVAVIVIRKKQHP